MDLMALKNDETDEELYQSCQSCEELLQAKVTAPPFIVSNYWEG